MVNIEYHSALTWVGGGEKGPGSGSVNTEMAVFQVPAVLDRSMVRYKSALTRPKVASHGGRTGLDISMWL